MVLSGMLCMIILFLGTISLVAPQAIIYMTDSALITPPKSDGTESLDNNSLRDN